MSAVENKKLLFVFSLLLSLALHTAVFFLVLLPRSAGTAEARVVLYVDVVDTLSSGGGEDGGGGSESSLVPIEKPEAPAAPLVAAPPSPPADTQKKPRPARERARFVSTGNQEKQVEPQLAETARHEQIESTTVSAEASAAAPEGGGDAGIRSGSGNGFGTGDGQGAGFGRGTGEGSGGPGSKYGRMLARWLERHKRYPEEARQNGVKGEALVKVRIDRDGNLLEEEILKSAGHPVLDDAVHQLIARATPFPAVPDEYRAHEVEFVVPVSFKLH